MRFGALAIFLLIVAILWTHNTSALAIDRSPLLGTNRQIHQAVPVSNPHVVAEFPVGGNPLDLTYNPDDGNIYFTDQANNAIGILSPAGTLREFGIPETGGSPFHITAGSDGNVWFAESFAGGQIGRITPSGSITMFQTPTRNSNPVGIAAGPDGALWATETSVDKIARISTDGSIVEYPILTGFNVNARRIVAGSDNRMHFVECNVRRLGAIDQAGVISSVVEPPPGRGACVVAQGPDGNLWLNEFEGSVLRFTPPNTFTAFPFNKADFAIGMTGATDGKLYFVLQVLNLIGRINPQNGLAETYRIPTPNSVPVFIVQGAGRTLWFTEYNGKIGEFAY
jgi:streptogramin lyase